MVDQGIGSIKAASIHNQNALNQDHVESQSQNLDSRIYGSSYATMLAHAMGTASSGGASNTNGGDNNYMFLAGVQDVEDDLETNKYASDQRMSLQNSNHNANQRATLMSFNAAQSESHSHSRIMQLASQGEDYQNATRNQVNLSEKLGVHEAGSITDIAATRQLAGNDAVQSQGSAGMNSTLKNKNTNPFM